MWWTIAKFVIAIVISNALRPKPETPKPSSLNDLEVPTAEEGKPIPILFGTRTISDMNCLYYGDLKTTAVKKKGGKK